MFMTVFLSGSVLALLLLTAWGSYQHYTGIHHTAPLWRLIAVDTLRRTVPVILLIATVTSLMSIWHS
jgi:hypothetical protein